MTTFKALKEFEWKNKPISEINDLDGDKFAVNNDLAILRSWFYDNKDKWFTKLEGAKETETLYLKEAMSDLKTLMKTDALMTTSSSGNKTLSELIKENKWLKLPIDDRFNEIWNPIKDGKELHRDDLSFSPTAFKFMKKYLPNVKVNFKLIVGNVYSYNLIKPTIDRGELKLGEHVEWADKDLKVVYDNAKTFSDRYDTLLKYWTDNKLTDEFENTPFWDKGLEKVKNKTDYLKEVRKAWTDNTLNQFGEKIDKDSFAKIKVKLEEFKPLKEKLDKWLAEFPEKDYPLGATDVKKKITQLEELKTQIDSWTSTFPHKTPDEVKFDIDRLTTHSTDHEKYKDWFGQLYDQWTKDGLRNDFGDKPLHPDGIKLVRPKLEELKGTIITLTLEKATVKEQKDTLTNEKATLEADKEKLKTDLDSRDTTISDHKNTIKEKETIIDKIKDLPEKLAILNQQLTDKDTELNKRNEEINALTNEQNTTERELKTWTDTFENLKPSEINQQITDLTNNQKPADYDQIKTDLETIKYDLKIEKELSIEIVNKLNEKGAELKTANEKITTLEVDKKKAQKELNDLGLEWENDDFISNVNEVLSVEGLKAVKQLLKEQEAEVTKWKTNFPDQEPSRVKEQAEQQRIKLLEVQKQQIVQMTKSFYLNDLGLHERDDLRPLYDERNYLDILSKSGNLRSGYDPKKIINAFKITALIGATKKAQIIADKYKDNKNKVVRNSKLKYFQNVKSFWELNYEVEISGRNEANPLWSFDIINKDEYKKQIDDIIIKWTT